MPKKKKGGKKKSGKGASKAEAAEQLPPLELTGIDYKYRVAAQDALNAVVDFLVTDGLEATVEEELRKEILSDALLEPFAGVFANDFAETLHFCIKLSLSSPFLDQEGFGAVVLAGWKVLHELAEHWYAVVSSELGVEQGELQSHLWKVKGKSIACDDARLLGACEVLGMNAENLRNDSKKHQTRWFVIQRMRTIARATKRAGGTPPWKRPWSAKAAIEKVGAEILARVTASGPPMGILIHRGKVVAVDVVGEAGDIEGARQAMQLPASASCRQVVTEPGVEEGGEPLTDVGKCRVYMAGGPLEETEDGGEESAAAEKVDAPPMPRNVVGTMVLKRCFLKHELQLHKDTRTVASYACVHGPLLVVLPAVEDWPEARDAVLADVARVAAGILTCWGQSSMKSIFPDFVAAGEGTSDAGASAEKSSAK
jgi:hypothetical protein